MENYNSINLLIEGIIERNIDSGLNSDFSQEIEKCSVEELEWLAIKVYDQYKY